LTAVEAALVSALRLRLKLKTILAVLKEEG
jgi:hypothetical protein